MRGGSAAAEDSVSGLRKEKEKVEEQHRQAETMITGETKKKKKKIEKKKKVCFPKQV